MKNSKKVLSYTISDTITIGILAACGLPVLILSIMSGELYWWLITLMGLACLWFVFEILRCIIIDFTIIFNNDGFMVRKYNIITHKEVTHSYRWKEISGLSFIGLYCSSASPRIIVFYKGGGHAVIRFRYSLKHSDFIRFAQEYSGRTNIIS